MEIAFNSELMDNQKHATVMTPGLAFAALQSDDGDALFFSIATDGVFCLTRELRATSTGWDRVDLSSVLAAQHGGASLVAKTFAVAQNEQTLAVDIALVVTVDHEDFLYLSLGNANTDASWAEGVTWSAIPFDAGAAPQPLTISDVLLLSIPALDGAAAERSIFVDILRTPGNTLRLIDRYYIVPGATPRWNRHQLAADLSAGSISCCLGRRTNDPVPGIYTFGTIAAQPQLIFTPQYNFFRPSAPPNPARLTLPRAASAIAAALDGAGTSNLFVAGADGLFLFTPDNQGDEAAPVQIVPGGLVASASALTAITTAKRTAVWGLGPKRILFYLACPAGSEADPSAWSPPVSLVSGALGFAFFIDSGASSNVLFAQIDGNELIQLTQDPVTTDWQQRGILLPPTGSSDLAEFHSFTTHIEVLDDNGAAAPGAAVTVTATSPVSVYLNDVYYLLSPTAPLSTAADATGTLTVIQQTQSLAAVCFRVALVDAPGVAVEIDPMSRALATLGTVNDGEDLSAVQITGADGSSRPLVPASVPSADKDAAAKAISQFVKVSATLPPDGSRQSASGAARAKLAAAAGATGPALVWGISFADDGFEYHEGQDAARRFAPALIATSDGGLSGVGGIDTAIEMAAGDFFRWLEQVFDDVESFVVREAEGLYHLLATIAGKVYDVLLDCIDAIAHAVEFVFNEIKVLFEDLIAWLGFVFDWSDILRTHAVLKNVFNAYMAKCLENLQGTRTQLQAAFTDIEKYIDAWAGIPDNIPPALRAGGVDSSTRSSQPAPGLDSPQSNWGLYHLKSNAAGGSTAAPPNKGVSGDVLATLQPLADALEREQQIFEAAFSTIEHEIVEKFHELSFEQVVKDVVAVAADALLESVENLLLTAIDVLVALSEGVIDVLNATIDIPVISTLYEKVTGAQMSLLDVTCLVAAIPVTVCFKLIAGVSPFPDDATTSALIAAPDFASIQRICNQPQAARPPRAASAASTLPGAPAAGSAPSVNSILVLTGGIASAVGAVSLSVFSPLKQKFPEAKVFTVLSGLSYPLYVAPDIFGQIPDLRNTKWWAITNETIADLMFVKSIVDMGVGLTVKGSSAQGAWNPVSPWLDFAGNIAWEVPTIAAALDSENWNTAGQLSYWGGTCFDCNGIMSPVLADDSEPISWGVAVAVAALFNLAYGSLSCAASVLSFNS